MSYKHFLLFLLVFTFPLFSQSYHTITIDGVNDFTTGTEQYQTTSGTQLYGYVTWDKNYLYVGYSGNSVVGPVTDDTRNYHIYIDTDPQKNPATGTGTQAGEPWRYTPTLPFTANIHYAFKTADNSEVRRSYVGNQWQNTTFQTVNWKGNGFWEIKIALADIGSPKQINILSFVEEDWSGGSVCGGLPANLFTNNTSGGNITFANHWLNYSLLDQTIPNLAYNLDNYSWMIRLKANIFSLNDSSAYAGMALKATNGLDANVDLPKPPTAPSNYIEVFFPHTDWLTALGPNFSRDIRALISLDSTSSTWNFTVRTDQRSSNVTLTGDQFSSIPSNYNIFIQDIAAGIVHNVRTQGAYTYNSGIGGGDRFFNLTIGVTLSSPHIVAAPTALDFGSVKIGKDSTINVILSNTGDSSLVISNIVSTNSVFTFTGGTSYTITKNNSVTIPVKFTPPSAATYNGNLRVTSNDPANITVDIALQGVGLSLFPGISVSTNSLSFGGVKVDYDSTMSFKVYNPGDTTLNITGITSTTGQFKVVGSSTFSINKKDSAVVSIKFSPSAVAVFNDTLLIRNNTIATSTMKVTLSGSGTLVTTSHTFSKGWNLISVPITQANASVAAVIGDNLISYLLYNYSGGAFTNADSVIAGKGYWLGIENVGLVDVTGTPKTTNFTETFTAGWNLLASPYVRSFPKSKIEFKRGSLTVSADSAVSLGWIQNVYYGYRQSDSSYTLNTDLTNWSGYFSAGLKDSLQAIFIHDSAGTASKSIRSEKFIPDEYNWQVTIAANMNGSKDAMLDFGVGMQATNGFDARYDLAKPPMAPVSGSIETYFPSSTWSPYFTKYASDIRAPFTLPAPGKQWSFNVFSQVSGTMKLSWDQILSQMPASIRANYRFNLAGPGVSSLDMLSNTGYSFQVAGGTTYTFGINSTTTGVETNPVKKYSFDLGQNYPNPFNPSTTIWYSLPEKATVSLRVYDLIGKEIAVLFEGEKEAGSYSLDWNASNFVSGVYFYKLKTEKTSLTKKLILMK